MKCSNCGQENIEGTNKCVACGVDLLGNKDDSANDSNRSNTILPAVISIVAGIISMIGSYKMVGIKSVAGNSIAESFYSSFGIFGIGFSLFMISMGIYMLQRNN